jgi:hypothetical protein
LSADEERFLDKLEMTSEVAAFRGLRVTGYDERGQS